MNVFAPLLFAAYSHFTLIDQSALNGDGALARIGMHQIGDDSSVCVENGTDRSFYFAAEARGGKRAREQLAPGKTLCVTGQGGGGVVSVFESPDVIEGCSRLVDGTQTETLLRYADFDRCAWSSHS